MTRSADQHAVIVGAGVYGAALAQRFSDRGWQVTLVEQSAPGHVRSASGGESRLLRCSYGGDHWYAELAWRALELWRELQQRFGREILLPTGVTYFANRPDGWERDSERVLLELGVPVERLDPGSAQKLFPRLTVDDLCYVLLEPAAGVIRAREATHLLVEDARRSGTRILRARALPDSDGRVRVGERTIAGDAVIWACGPWLRSLFPEVIDVVVTRQVALYLSVDAVWATPPTPAWIDQDAEYYGLGDLDGAGFKFAFDQDGEVLDPDRGDRLVRAREVEEARTYLSRRFPGLAHAPVVGAEVGYYATSRRQEFIVDRLPGHDRTWVVGGESGHGFKHAPAVAEYLEQVVTGARQAEPRWRLNAEPSIHHEHHHALR